MRGLIEYRVVLSLAVSAVTGAVGLHVYPFPSDHVVLALVRLERPLVYAGFAYTYAALWVSSSFFLASVGFSCLYIFVPRDGRSASMGPLPPYPAPEHRADLFVVLGEQHRRSTPERAATPTWLTIPERGLYTGTLIVGAIGSGKTSACMYPYVEQLLAYRASDPVRKAAGLVLEVKGDFCRQVRDILTRHGRADDYVEVSLDSPYRYNPLHNDLDAYALAYGIATLMTNLFGRGKEPFWQQASTNLVKFVILLHQTLDDYVTLVPGLRARHQPRQAAGAHRGGRATLPRQPPPHRAGQARAPVHDRAARLVVARRRDGHADVGRVVGGSRGRAQGGRHPVIRRTRDAAGTLGRQDGPVRGRQAVVRGRLDADRAEAAHVHRRGHQRVPLAVRRQPPGEVHVLPTEGHLRRRSECRRDARHAAAAARGSDRAGEDRRAQLPDRDESRLGARDRHDVEAGLPTGGAQPRPSDGHGPHAQPASGAVRVR